MSLCFVVTEDLEDGGFTACASIPNTKSGLITEGNSLSDLYKNIIDVVECYCTATNSELPANIKVQLPAIPPTSIKIIVEI
jgi:hypothetical protein